MGKTASGSIWLNVDKLSPYDFWQFWRNTEDSDVGRFLRLFTEQPEDEIKRLETLEGSEINAAKIILADEITALCHGQKAAIVSRQTAEKSFTDGDIAEGLPSVNIQRDDLANNSLLDLFVKSGLVTSKGEIRRLIRGGGARLNNIQIINEDHQLSADDFNENGHAQIAAGKKRRAILILGN